MRKIKHNIIAVRCVYRTVGVCSECWPCSLSDGWFYIFNPGRSTQRI